jgi:hypothetical protein
VLPVQVLPVPVPVLPVPEKQVLQVQHLLRA